MKTNKGGSGGGDASISPLSPQLTLTLAVMGAAVTVCLGLDPHLCVDSGCFMHLHMAPNGCDLKADNYS